MKHTPWRVGESKDGSGYVILEDDTVIGGINNSGANNRDEEYAKQIVDEHNSIPALIESNRVMFESCRSLLLRVVLLRHEAGDEPADEVENNARNALATASKLKEEKK